MKLFCARCGEELDLKQSRIEGSYKYVCYYCETIQKKAEMLTSEMVELELKKNPRRFEPIYHCSSCDYPIWTKEELDTCDGCGRCERCQEEYGDIDEF